MGGIQDGVVEGSRGGRHRAIVLQYQYFMDIHALSDKQQTGDGSLHKIRIPYDEKINDPVTHSMRIHTASQTKSWSQTCAVPYRIVLYQGPG